MSNDRLSRFIKSTSVAVTTFDAKNGLVQKLTVIHTGEWILTKNPIKILHVLKFIEIESIPGKQSILKPFSRSFAFVDEIKQISQTRKRKLEEKNPEKTKKIVRFR